MWGEGDDAYEEDWGACCELAWGEPTLTVAMHPPPVQVRPKARGKLGVGLVMQLLVANLCYALAPQGPLGYFAFEELKLVSRFPDVVAAFEQRERERREAVLGESEFGGGPPGVLGGVQEFIEGDVVSEVGFMCDCYGIAME